MGRDQYDSSETHRSHDGALFDLPEDQGASFDEAALLEAMRDYRRRQFAELAQLDS